ncbi:RRQRL motif-containing zinc-binding protein [Crossiella sp. CA198]|uniref:RRQRL motif-containing zinc-binding protein n=1 Tax=Crossiella sp. CA198 TaxID=3455607 RepID=UPI003F8D3E9B
MARQFPWLLAAVAWSQAHEWIRGHHDGLPLLSYGCAPKHLLATRRQLRAQGLRPNGQDPVALLYLRHNASKKFTVAHLYLIAAAAPVRPMTPARWTALAKANQARRICRTCGRDPLYILPTSTKQCWPCWETDHATDTTEIGAAA